MQVISTAFTDGRIPRLLLLSTILYLPVLAKPPVEKFTKPSEQVAKVFKAGLFQAINTEKRPEYAQLEKEIIELTRKLVIPEDGDKPIQVVIIESMHPTAFLLNPEDGPRVLGLHTGLLRFLKTDDELAFVIGQELEHGVSQLAKHIQWLQSNRQNNVIELMGLKRAVKTEVDVGAALRRVHRNGLNPRASTALWERFIREFRDDIGYSYPLFQSRIDSISLALTAIRRGGGEKVKSDAPEEFQTRIVDAARKTVFEPERFKREQLERVERLLSTIENDFTEPLKQLKIPKKQRTVAVGSGTYQAVHDYYAAQLAHLTTKLIPDKEYLDLELRLHAILHGKFEEARVAALGPDLKSLSYEQLGTLKELYDRNYVLSISERNINNGDPNLPYTLYRAAEARQAYLQKQLEIQHASTPEAAARLRAESDRLKEEATRTMRSAELELHTYDSRVVDLVEKYRALRGDSPAVNQMRSKLFRDIAALRRVVGPLQQHSDEMITRIEQGRFDTALREISDPNALARMVEKILGDSRETIEADPFRILEAYNTATRLELAKKGWEWGGPVQIWLSWNNDGTMELLDMCRSRDPRRVERFFGDWVDIVMDGAPHAKALQSVFAGMEPPRRSDNPAQFFVHGAMGDGVLFSPPLARAVWTEKRIATYLQKLEDLFAADMIGFLRREGSDRVQREFAETMESVISKIAYLKKHGFITPFVERDRGVDLLPERLFEVGADFLVKLSASGKSAPITQDQARALILARLPELRPDLDRQGKFPVTRIAAEIVELGKRTDLPERFGQPLSFLRFPLLFDQRPGRAIDPGLLETLYAGRRLVDWDIGTEHEYRMKHMGELDSIFPLAIETAAWARKNHPDDGKFLFDVANPHLGELGSEKTPWVPKFRRRVQELFTDRFDQLHDRYPDKSEYDRIRLAARDIWREIDWSVTSGHSNNTDVIKQAIKDLTPRNSAEVIPFINACLDGIEEVFADDKHKSAYTVTDRTDMESFEDAVRAVVQSRQGKIEDLLRAHANLVKYKGPSANSDGLYEYIWAMRDKSPDAKGYFDKPELVGKLFYDENRKTLALWQLEKRFGIESLSADLKKDRKTLPPKGSVRVQLASMKKLIDEQFPDKSGAKNDVITFVENKLLANAEEVEFLAGSKLTVKTWYENRRLAAVDLPREFSSGMDRYQHYQFLLYLAGASDDYPKVRSRYLSNGFKNEEEFAQATRRHFREADVYTRTYTLQPFLDEKDGPLSDPHLQAKIFEAALGQHAKDPLYREVVKAYFDSVPAGEKKSILGYIFASMADQPRKPASVKKVLEAMGVFGIKAGQFLRTSGYASPALRKDLDHFFDRALEPQRDEIFRKMTEVFGEGFRPVETVRELAGSGSVNYVIVADVAANGKKARRAVLRVRREYAEGQVGNENEIWEKATQLLRGSNVPGARRLAGILEETRSQAMTTLKPGGAEMDLSIEREAYPAAKRAYERGTGWGNRFKIVVAEPDKELQKLIPEEFQKKVSVYEAVDHVPLAEISDPELRRQAAVEIVQAELRAMFGRGAFDPDGHPGNWLVDVRNSRLVRVDYAQLRSPPAQEMTAAKQVIRGLLVPNIDASSRIELSKQIRQLLNVAEEDRVVEGAIQAALVDPKLPDFRQPHERLLFIRDKLDAQLGKAGNSDVVVGFRDSVRSVLTSLAKINIYSEHIPQKQYQDLLLRGLGLSPELYKASIVGGMMRDRVRSVIRDPGGALADCLEYLAGVVRGKRKP